MTHQVLENLMFTKQKFLCTENFWVALNTPIKKKKKSLSLTCLYFLSRIFYNTSPAFPTNYSSRMQILNNTNIKRDPENRILSNVIHVWLYILCLSFYKSTGITQRKSKTNYRLINGAQN